MSAKDKKRLAIAVGLVVVVAAALYFLLFRGKAAQEQAGAPATAPAGARSVAKAPEPAPSAPSAPAAGPPAAPAPGAPPAAAAPTPGAPPGTPGVPAGPPKPTNYREDPFKELYPPPPPPPVIPPPPPLAVEQVNPPAVRVATLPPVYIMASRREQERRMAGVLWNDRVWAIIEVGNKSSVVQPGDVFDGDTVRSISPQGLLLTSKSGKQAQVRLEGKVGAPAAAPTPVGVPAGRPGLPGMMPGGSMPQPY